MNHPLGRRQFVKLGSGIIAAGLAGFPRAGSSLAGSSQAGLLSTRKADMLPLSFSTLGCPDWNLAQILDFAAANGYKGIEFRGLQRQLDLPQCPEFSNARRIAETRRRFDDKGLSIVDLGSSVELHHAGVTAREHQLDDAKRYMELAEALHCPYVRVFPNRLPKEQERSATFDLIAKGLSDLGKFAKGGSVSVLMETHGDLVHAADVLEVMRKAANPHNGLVWDIYNMWSAAKEPPAEVYEKLKPYIRHTHIKDGLTVDGKDQLRPMGKGDGRVFEGVDVLVKGGYKGFYSFEWEKWWHPELEAPELAIGEYPKVMLQRQGTKAQNQTDD